MKVEMDFSANAVLEKLFFSQPVSIFENKIDRQNRLTFFLVLIDVDHRVVVGVVEVGGHVVP